MRTTGVERQLKVLVLILKSHCLVNVRATLNFSKFNLLIILFCVFANGLDWLEFIKFV